MRIWGARGSIPSPLTPISIRGKIIRALQGAVGIDLSDPIAIRAYVDDLHPVLAGTAGGNTSCVEIQASGKEIIIDAGSGIRDLGLNLMDGPCGRGEGEIHLFLSHTHWDHIQGFPFFLPAFVPGNLLRIYSVHDVESTIRGQMDAPSFPVSFGYMEERARIEFVPLEIGETIQIDTIKITNCLLPHPGDAYAYRFERGGNVIVFASDAEYKKLDDQSLKPFLSFFDQADILLFDAQYSLKDSIIKEDWGHSSSLIGADLARLAEVKRLVLFHHDPETTDVELIEILNNTKNYQKTLIPLPTCEILLAYEGLTIDLSPPGAYELIMIPDKQAAILRITEAFDQETITDVLDNVNHLPRSVEDSVGMPRLPRLIVDLSEVSQLSIAGLRSLIDLHRLWEGNTIALTSLTDSTRQVIEIANFIDLFGTYPNVERALASLEAHDALELKGELLENRYHIEEKLGAGEQSVIFKATDTRLERPVTIKVLSPNLSQSATRRLLRKTRQMARLRAPNIATIYDWDEEWGLAYLVTEYIGNQTLRDAMVSNMKIDPTSISIDILSALNYAHSKGAIHGNLKPENIIISDEVKLTDFGFWWAEEGTSLKDLPFMLGDPCYLAPEQILGEELNSRTDLYAVGLLLYELHTGKKPFGADPRSTMERRLVENPVSPRDLNQEISQTLDQLIMKLLSRNAKDRYASASQVRRILLGI